MKRLTYILALIVAGCQQPQQSQAEVGRFQVQQVGKRTILVDTDQGKVWELLEDDNGATKGWVEIKPAT